MSEKETLLRIGLSENEAQVYLALLKAGPLSANEIAQKTGIYRPHVYDKLETLMKKGIVSYVKKGKRKVFSGARPEKIQDYLKEKEEEINTQMQMLKENMKRLSDLQNSQREDTHVSVCVGVEGLKARLKDTSLCSQKEVLIFGLDDSKYQEVLPVFMPQHFKRLKENGIKERVIIPKRSDSFIFKNGLTTYRCLESKELNPVNTIIYGSKVAFVIWGTPITTIIVENKDMAKTYKEYFEQLWKSAEQI